MYFIFYGAEGSGKSTQAKLLADKFQLPYLSSGDLVRKYSTEDKGIMGDVCRGSLDKGYYVADSEMFVLWKHRLKESDVQAGWVIDGFPRNQVQAKFLADKLEKYGHQITTVFYLAVSEQESIKRLLNRGRKSPDGSLHDSPEKIASRLKMYQKEEKAVLNFYRRQKLLIEINGEPSIDVIHQAILEQIKGKKWG
ncbi:nucleoside monophosphate kinase [Patescibacteria group bacterium]|nr:nucleoside monophosphate kinase [Patescibacteria group bacterium]MBU1931298.1 nucleoside monophosphate kinase [Patescibacteria group bacterium]